MTGMPPMPADAMTLAQLAQGKLTRILGEVAGMKVFAETLQQIGRQDIVTPDDLYAFGEQLGKGGGIRAAVGSMLTVAAVVRGAGSYYQPAAPRPLT